MASRRHYPDLEHAKTKVGSHIGLRIEKLGVRVPVETVTFSPLSNLFAKQKINELAHIYT